jgi:hypothetical protein
MCGMLTYDVVFLQENGLPHADSSIPALLKDFNLEEFDHPP